MTISNRTDREKIQKRADDFLSRIGRCYADQVLKEYKKFEKDIAIIEVPEDLRTRVLKAVRTSGEETAGIQRQPLNILLTD